MNAFRIVQSLGLAWVALYTAGLGAAARDRRRAEIESDLFEYQRAMRAEGASPAAGAVASRFLRGVPDDIAWRLGYGVDPGMSDELIATWPGRIVLAALMGISAISLAWVFIHAFALGGERRIWAFYQLGMLVLTLLLIKGFALSSRAAWRGSALILASGLVLALFWMYWMPIAVIILIITAYGLWRAWRLSRERRPQRIRASSDRDPPPAPS